MNCQRKIWRDKHAARMADPERAERRRKQLADRDIAHARNRNPGSRARPDRPWWQYGEGWD